jgi:hypothetical protein
MSIAYFVRAGLTAFTSRQSGPTLYDVCDPVLSGVGPGDPHLRNFYKVAIANPALRPLLSRGGLPALQDQTRLAALRDALLAARDDTAPNWLTIARPVADLIDAFPQHHPAPPTHSGSSRMPAMSEIENIIGTCAKYLLGAFSRHGFVPTYAAFNLCGDPDLRGRDLVIALGGLQARTYRNATLMFNLARAFIVGNPAIMALFDPPRRGIAEPMWQPVQIRHRSAYYDAFFAESLMDYLHSGLALPSEQPTARAIISSLVEFCLRTSRERVPGPDGGTSDVITALVPPPHARMSRFFWRLKSDLGFGQYVPDCDTTACSLSAATQYGADDPILDQPMLDFYADYQFGGGANDRMPTVAINDTIDYDGGILTWIENSAGERPFGNDIDPTLNLDVLEVCFRNHERWRILERPQRTEALRGIVHFHDRLTCSGAFADPRSHIYYLPELYAAYVGRCYAAFRALPPAAREAIDPDGAFERIRRCVLSYVYEDLAAHEMNAFDAALALLALAKLDGEPQFFAAPLACVVDEYSRGRKPFRAYEWNKMKTPTRILVGGSEVTSAFVLSALVHIREALLRGNN